MAKIILIALVFTAPLAALTLPHVILPGPQTLDASSLQTPTYGESSTATILGESNWTQWSLNPTQSNTSLNTSNGLVLSGEFPSSPNPLAVSISRVLAVNLTEFPLMYMNLKMSTGVSYGIRFFSRASGGVIVPLWSDTDALDHTSGSGQFENIQVNMPQLIGKNHSFFSPTGEIRISQLSIDLCSLSRIVSRDIHRPKSTSTESKSYVKERPASGSPKCLKGRRFRSLLYPGPIRVSWFGLHYHDSANRCLHNNNDFRSNREAVLR